MPLSTLHPPRLFVLPSGPLRPNSHLNPLSISCCRRFASVSGRSLGCTLFLGVCVDFPFLVEEVLSLALLSLEADDAPPPPTAPWLERQVSVLERKLPPDGAVFPKEFDVFVGLEAATGGGRAEIATVDDVGVEVPEDDE